MPTAAWIGLFAAYAWIVSTLSAAWYLRRMATARGEEVSVAASLVWQGANYGIWFLVGGAVWLILRRLGAGAAAAAACWGAGLIVVPLAALTSTAIDRAFGLGAPEEMLARTIDRLPVAILL